MIFYFTGTGNSGYIANEIALFVDSETGIQYFVMNHGNLSCMCPRLDKDGKPMVWGNGYK